MHKGLLPHCARSSIALSVCRLTFQNSHTLFSLLPCLSYLTFLFFIRWEDIPILYFSDLIFFYFYWVFFIISLLRCTQSMHLAYYFYYLTLFLSLPFTPYHIISYHIDSLALISTKRPFFSNGFFLVGERKGSWGLLRLEYIWRFF
jgi:hypothetical protein